MIAYVSGTCSKEITGMSVERIDISDEIGWIDWDEQDFALDPKEGEFSSRLKGIYFDDEYANEKGEVLKNMTAYVEFNIYEVNGIQVEGEEGVDNIPWEKVEELAKSIKITDITFEDEEIDYVLESRESEEYQK